MNEFLVDIFDEIFKGTEHLNPIVMAMTPFMSLVGFYTIGYIGTIIKKWRCRKKGNGKKK